MKIYIKTAGVKIENKLMEEFSKKYIIVEKESVTIEDVVTILKLKEQSFISYMLNGNHADECTQLKNGDELLFMSVLYGG